MRAVNTVDISEGKKLPLSLKVRAELKQALKDWAKREDRSEGNLGELLLEWAFRQLQNAGDTITLKKLAVVFSTDIHSTPVPSASSGEHSGNGIGEARSEDSLGSVPDPVEQRAQQRLVLRKQVAHAPSSKQPKSNRTAS